VTVNTIGSTADSTSVLYHVEVEGRLEPEWAAWFGAERIEAAAGRTGIYVRVADQAQLHGVLRRVHDLHLHLIRLDRIDDAGP
jgi:hypothetical protein